MCLSPVGPGEMSLRLNVTGLHGSENSLIRPGLARRSPSDLYDKFWVGVGEALKLVLVQVHDEELVRGRQLHRHLRELLVEVADIGARFLPWREEREGTAVS